MLQENRIHLIAGLVLLVLGVLGVAVLIPLGVDEPSQLQFAALSPSYWPRIICISLSLFGAGIVASIVLKRRSGETDDRDVESAAVGSDATPFRALAAIVLLFVLYMVLEPLGFVLAGALALAAYMLLAGERRPMIVAPVAVGVPLLLYLFFTKAAQVPIPAGVLEPILV